MANEKIDADTMSGVYNALESLHAAVKSNTKSQGEIDLITTKCEETLSKFDDAQNKWKAELAVKEQANEELEQKLLVIEKQIARLPGNSVEYAQSKAETKAFKKFLRYGKDGMNTQHALVGGVNKEAIFTPEEIKLMRTDVNPQGGFLVPEDFRLEILKLITEASPVRQVARSTTTSLSAVTFPKRQTIVQTAFVGEAGLKAESNSTYGQEVIKLNKVVALVSATLEMLNDTAFDIANEIQMDVVEDFAIVEGRKFVNGNSVNEPEGFMIRSDVPSIPSGIANDISGDNLIDLTGALKSGQSNLIFAMNRRTVARVRKLKDSVGAFLFHLESGLQTGIGSSIAGFPFVSMIDIADIAAGSEPIIFGDFRRGYMIVDGIALSVIRDDFTALDRCEVRFGWQRQVGGQVVLEDAFVKLKVESP